MADLFNRLLGRISGPRTTPAGMLFFLYTAALFLFFLLLTFPHDIIATRYTRQIEANTGWRVLFDRVRLVPWAGYRFSELRLLPFVGAPHEWFHARSMDLRPTLGSLLRGSFASVVFDAESYRGSLSGYLLDTMPRTFALAWQDLDLSAAPALSEVVGGQWQGRVSGAIEAALGDQIPDYEGSASFQLRGGSLTRGATSGFTIPDFTGVTGDGSATLKAGRIELTALKLTAEQVDVEVRGQIVVQIPPGNSRLNLVVTATPVPGNAGIDALLRIASRGKPPTGGAYRFTLYNTLAQPRIR